MKFVTLLVLLLSSTAYCEAAEVVWHHAMMDDPISNSDVYVLRQASTTTIKDANAKDDVTPEFELYCSLNDPNVMARVNWNRFISSFSTEAGFKVDDGKFNWLKLKVDASEQVTYSSSATDSQRLIELLSAGDSLVIDISPYSEAPVQAFFDISNFAAELAKLSAKCQ